MTNKIVRLDTGPWTLTQEEFNYYTPNRDGIINGYQFIVNSPIKSCDFWVIRGSIQNYWEIVRYSKNNLVYLMDEAYDEAEYPLIYINQFDACFGPKRLNSANYRLHHEMHPWLFRNISYSFLQNSFNDLKTRDICIIASDATWLKGHKDRFAFVNKLIGHYKHRIDLYGKGFNSFECKFEVLKHYKYSVCIENSSIQDYFTEKINECYLADCMPIYYGCPNISEYYDSDSLIRIDIHDFQSAIQLIDNALSNNFWEKNIDKIRLMKKRYFSSYHLPQKLTELLDQRELGKRKYKLIFHRNFFIEFNQSKRMFFIGALQFMSKLSLIIFIKTFSFLCNAFKLKRF
jgi:hypothetical protein